MDAILAQIEAHREEIRTFETTDPELLEAFRIRFLGTRGIIKALMGEMKNVPADRRRDFGQVMNAFKEAAEARHAALKDALSQSEAGPSGPDATLPGDPLPTGGRHPITIMRNRIVSIFRRMGFAVAEGPEIEDDWHNFTALNLGEDHPARDMQDTFYLSRRPDMLLRTHTSNVQIREMQRSQPPIRIVCPGRVYRNETVSARSHCFFHQVEGLYIDEGVSFADLKQTLYAFVREMFGEDVRVRFRPSYFPFTEPSAEMDISCMLCKGEGCAVCKRTGWLEILGCGMVHPQVLSNCGIDPEKYNGYAFGMGIERPAMLKYGITDIRLFSENDVRFLRQFSAAT